METSPPLSLKHERRLITVLVLAVLLIHAPSLLGPFFIDDYVYIHGVSDMDWPRVVDIFTSSTLNTDASGVWWAPEGELPFYRPIGEMTFALDYAVWGLTPFGFHLTNLLLHAACTILTWRVGRRLFDEPVWGLVTAAVFALHPVHYEAVTWVSGRFDLLVCLWMLASVLCYLRWQESVRRPWIWGTLALVMFVLGLASKETALTLPGVLFVAEALRWRGAEAGYRKSRLVTAAAVFGVISVLYLAGRFAMFGGLGELPPPYGLDRSSPVILAQGIVWNCAQYLLDFVFFIQVDAFYLAQFWSSHLGLMAPLLVLAVLITGWGIVLAWRSTALRVGLVWVVVFTSPALLAMPGERNVYLSSVGVALMAAAVLRAIGARTATRPSAPLWVKRVSFALVGLWIVLGLAEQGITWCLGSTGEKVFRDLEAAIPNPDPDTRIFVVNQSPLNSVGFEQALQLRYGRRDLRACALSLSPTLEMTSTDSITITGPDSIRVDRKGGVYFKSFVERFHLFSEPASGLAESAKRVDLELLNPPDSLDGVTRFEFRLPYPIGDPRLHLFIWNNEHVRGPTDFVRMITQTELKPFDPNEPPTAINPRPSSTPSNADRQPGGF